MIVLPFAWYDVCQIEDRDNYDDIGDDDDHDDEDRNT